MFTAQQLMTPGDKAFFIDGNAGLIEASLMVPDTVNTSYLALLGHPHSLQGGTMQNKVVTTLARTFKALGIASVRFNFRGVGQSEGVYAEGLGESDDMLAMAQQCLTVLPDASLCFAGFSFGSYVAYRAAAQMPHALLVTVAPSVQHYDYTAWPSRPSPWFVVQGDADEVVPSQMVLDFARMNALTVLEFAHTGHFFHSKLLELQARLTEIIEPLVGGGR